MQHKKLIWMFSSLVTDANRDAIFSRGCSEVDNLVPRVSLLCLPWSLEEDPGCGWTRDHLSIQNRRVGGCSSKFGREDDKIPSGGR